MFSIKAKKNLKQLQINIWTQSIANEPTGMYFASPVNRNSGLILKKRIGLARFTL